MVTKIICDPIKINGSLTRHEIVQKVINIFINTEHQQRGKGVKFWYPVEQLSANTKLEDTQLFIFRPGGLQKWNFDFKVNVTADMGMGKGTHKDIESDMRSKKSENPEQFKRLLNALNEVYNCSENDVDRVLEIYHNLQTSFRIGSTVEILFKVLKWMFIMEDIVYWNYDGRAKLYNYLNEI